MKLVILMLNNFYQKEHFEKWSQIKKKKRVRVCVARGAILSSSSFMRYIFIITESGENGTPQITVVRIVCWVRGWVYFD